MRIRTLSLTLVFALAACQGDPTAPDTAASLSSGHLGSGIGSASEASADSPFMGGGGSRDGSPAIGTGLREDDGTGLRDASADSPLMGGGGSRDGSPAIGTGLREDGPTSTSSVYVGGGNREAEEPASASSVYMGGGNREADESAPSRSGYLAGGHREAGPDGSVSVNSTFMGGGTRDGSPAIGTGLREDGTASTNSTYLGGGNRTEEEEDSPQTGGSGGE